MPFAVNAVAVHQSYAVGTGSRLRLVLCERADHEVIAGDHFQALGADQSAQVAAELVEQVAIAVGVVSP